MSAETLVEALEKAGVPSNCGPGCDQCDETRLVMAMDADTLLPILARFAAPEVKREVLRTLLGERIAELSDPEDKPWPFVRFPSVPSGKAGMTVPVFGLLSVLVPSPAPMEGTNDE